MADLKLALPRLLKNEGGYSNDPDDTGGETYRGISRKNFPEWRGWNIVDAHKPLKDEEIIVDGSLDADIEYFYRINFWNVNRLDEVSDQEIATKLLDMCVNLGSSRAIKILQQELNIVLGIELKVDGNMGPQTLSALNKSNPEELLDYVRLSLSSFYMALAIKRPQNQKFLKGWLRRANQ